MRYEIVQSVWLPPVTVIGTQKIKWYILILFAEISMQFFSHTENLFHVIESSERLFNVFYWTLHSTSRVCNVLDLKKSQRCKVSAMNLLARNDSTKFQQKQFRQRDTNRWKVLSSWRMNLLKLFEWEDIGNIIIFLSFTYCSYFAFEFGCIDHIPTNGAQYTEQY